MWLADWILSRIALVRSNSSRASKGIELTENSHGNTIRHPEECSVDPAAEADFVSPFLPGSRDDNSNPGPLGHKYTGTEEQGRHYMDALFY